MARSRGSIEHRRRLAALPFVVECPIPPSGLMRRLDEMHAWAQRTCGNDGYATSSREDRSSDAPAQILRVHFAALRAYKLSQDQGADRDIALGVALAKLRASFPMSTEWELRSWLAKALAADRSGASRQEHPES